MSHILVAYGLKLDQPLFPLERKSLGCVDVVKPVLYQPTQTGCELWIADILESCPSTDVCLRFYFEISQRKRGILFFSLPPAPWAPPRLGSRSASLRVRNW